MSSQESKPTEIEREQIQDDIERLQLALQEDDDNESDEGDALQIVDSAFTDESQPGPSGLRINKIEDETEEDEAVPVLQLESSDLAQLQMVEDEGGILINPETCLALNRAYQEILLDLLRKIEIALKENRKKQTTLEEDFTEKSKKKNWSCSNPNSITRPVTNFSVPFFKDINGRHAPPNEDVLTKSRLEEIRQDIAPPLPWYKSQRDILIAAVKRESQDLLIRPLMNKKEIDVDRFLLADKNDKAEEKQDIKLRLDEINSRIAEIRNLSIEQLSNMVLIEDIDWMKISNIDFQGKRTHGDCRKFWQNVQQPKVNKDKWIDEEINLLKELVAKHQMRNWKVIAEELGTGRSAYQCLQYYQQNLNDTYCMREWTEEEDDLLKEVVENCKVGNRISWIQVSYFIEGRSQHQCLQRWMQINPEVRRGRWTDEEDCLLLTAISVHGMSNWKLIQEMVPGRTAYQCRERYTSCLDPKLKLPTNWTYEEDKALLLAVQKHTHKGRFFCVACNSMASVLSSLASTHTHAIRYGISWVKVASELEGRTDNMVLHRYRRLMSWKARSDWLEKQDTETQMFLGAVFNKSDGKGSTKQVTAEGHNMQLSKGLIVDSGVKEDDYLKQVQDKEAGDIVVPRPPLSYKYHSRNLEHMWLRKQQLQALVEDHLSRTMNKAVTAQDKMLIPKKAAQEFQPFVNMSKSQKSAMDNLFKDKDPSKLKVCDILEVSKKLKNRRPALVSRIKRFSKDHKLDKQMGDILQMKNYTSVMVRASSGRPKKFYIFYPYGRKPTYDVPENVQQLTSVSTTLMLSALEVNGRKALENAQKKPEDEMTESEKENYSLLKKLFPPLPPGLQGVRTQGKEGVTLQSLRVASPGSAPAVQVTTSSVVGSGTMQGNITTQTKTVKNSGDQSSSRSEANTSVRASSAQPSSSNVNRERPLVVSSTANLSVRPAVVRTVPSTKLTPVVTSSSCPIPSTSNSDLKSQRLVKFEPSSRAGGETSGLQHPRVVVVQKKGTPNPKNIPLLPPGLKNTEAFAGLLLQRKLLAATAEQMYNVNYYRHQFQNVQDQKTIKKEPEEEEANLQTTVIDSFKDKSSLAVMRGAKCINRKRFRREKDNSMSLKDPLTKIRKTPEFQLLQKRFEGLFTWPALLSTIKTSDRSKISSTPKALSGKGARREQRKIYEAGKDLTPEANIDMDDLYAAGEKGFAYKVKTVLDQREKEMQEKKIYPSKRYACTGTKHFYRQARKDKEWKQYIKRKRMVARRVNKELQSRGVSLKQLDTKSNLPKKQVFPVRKSARIAKQEAVNQPKFEKSRKRKAQNNLENSDVLEGEKTDHSLQQEVLTVNDEQSEIEKDSQIAIDKNFPATNEYQNPIEGQGMDSDIKCGNGVEMTNEITKSDMIDDSLLRQQNNSGLSSAKKARRWGPGEQISTSSQSKQDVSSHVAQGQTDTEIVLPGETLTEGNVKHHEDHVQLDPKKLRHSISNAASGVPNLAPGNQISAMAGQNDKQLPSETLPTSLPRESSEKILDNKLLSTTDLSSQSKKVNNLEGAHTNPSLGSDPSPHSSSSGILQGLNTQSPVTSALPPNITTPFVCPGLGGHILFAIPVDQLAQSTGQMNSSQPNQEGIFPVTLLINTNTMSVVSQSLGNTMSTSQNTMSRTTSSENKTELPGESVTITSSSVNQMEENLSTSQTEDDIL